MTREFITQRRSRQGLAEAFAGPSEIHLSTEPRVTFGAVEAAFDKRSPALIAHRQGYPWLLRRDAGKRLRDQAIRPTSMPPLISSDFNQTNQTTSQFRPFPAIDGKGEPC
jgi:hypothetical protein